MDYNLRVTCQQTSYQSKMDCSLHVTCQQTSYQSKTQTTIHDLLQYEVCCQVTHRLQSMSYYGMRLADKLHAGYNPCLTPV
jgi:hypothetical protein